MVIWFSNSSKFSNISFLNLFTIGAFAGTINDFIRASGGHLLLNNVNISLETKKDPTSTDKIIYNVTLSESSKCDLDILLNNGTTIRLPKGSTTVSKSIFLNEHNILSLATMYNINFDSIFKSPTNLHNLCINIIRIFD